MSKEKTCEAPILVSIVRSSPLDVTRAFTIQRFEYGLSAEIGTARLPTSGSEARGSACGGGVPAKLPDGPVRLCRLAVAGVAGLAATGLAVASNSGAGAAALPFCHCTGSPICASSSDTTSQPMTMQILVPAMVERVKLVRRTRL
eukprot:7294699-Prymnesium_polylepis.2